MYVTLEEAKRHLNIDVDYTGEDVLINSLIEVSESAVENEIDQPLSAVAYGILPPPLRQAVLLMVGNLYANRESIAYTTVTELPLSYKYLVTPYKAY